MHLPRNYNYMFLSFIIWNTLHLIKSCHTTSRIQKKNEKAEIQLTFNYLEQDLFYILLYKSAPIFDNAYWCTWVRIYVHHPHERHGFAPTTRQSRIKIAGCVLNVWHYKFKRKLSLTTQTNNKRQRGAFLRINLERDRALCFDTSVWERTRVSG